MSSINAEAFIWWWAPSWKIHNYMSFIILNLNDNFQELTIGAEKGGLFRKIFDAFGGGDIDFESHEFSERYNIARLEPRLAHLLKIRSLMPNYLFAD